MRRQQKLQKQLFTFTSALGISVMIITAVVFYSVHVKQDASELRRHVQLAAQLLSQTEATAPQRILNTLNDYPLIAMACLYSVTGELVAAHTQPPTASGQCPSRIVQTGAGGQIITAAMGSRDRPQGTLQAYAASRPGYASVLEIAGPLILTLITLIAIVLVASRYIAGALRQRREAEDAERDTRALLKRLVDLVPYLIFAIDKNGRVLFANQAIADLYNTTLDDLLDPQFATTHLAHEPDDGLVFAPFTNSSLQEEIWHTDAITEETKRFLVTRVPYEDDDTALVIGIDVTEEHRLQLQLQFSQRLEVIGTLAGGVAHDFNNLLTPILGYTSMLINSDLPEDAREKLRFVESAAERARDVVHQILTFSRQQQSEPRRELLEPTTVVRDAVQLMRASIPSGISLIEDNQSVGNVRVDPSQLHQVIVNLCTNASQAIESGVGTITLRVFEASPDSGLIPARLAHVTYACIEVADTGQGMTSEVVSHIFEPFFTTKEVGKGSGLGLSVVHGIVAAHGGDITVETAEGAGSTFRVLLPLAAQSPAIPAIPAPTGPSAQRVLLVDDDDSVLRVIEELLSHYGYQVSAMIDPAAALDAVKANPTTFDVIVTDHNMPQMTGAKLAASVRAIRPDIPIILITGFASVAAKDLEGIDRKITKPISGRELNLAIQSSLSARRSAA